MSKAGIPGAPVDLQDRVPKNAKDLVIKAHMPRGGIKASADGMWEHDQDVGKLLKKLDDLGIADDTIVIYTTENGPNQFSWPVAVTTPFRSEKDTN